MTEEKKLWNMVYDLIIKAESCQCDCDEDGKKKLLDKANDWLWKEEK